MELNIQFQHAYQVKIADLLWNAQDQKSVNVILKAFGKEGYVVHQMMIAAAMDEMTETDLAISVLDKIAKM
jgi:hypothetical protein